MAKKKTSRAKTNVRVGGVSKTKSTSGLLRSRWAALVLILAFIGIGVGSFAWVNAATSTYSLWPKKTVPKTITDSDNQSVELGTKFKSKYSGEVKGLRFYKGPQNTGTHTGTLWGNDGRKLAVVTFKNETASGWQTAYFDKPVAISANTTYVVSYFAQNGRYSVNESYFTSERKNGPLTAPKNAGVYAYGGQSSFPKEAYNASNYWVDVIFSTKRFTPTPKPLTPSGLKATVSGTNVTLKWTDSASTGVAKHEVLRNGQIIGLGAGAAYVDSGLTAGQEYSYQVRAVDGTGLASDLSNTAKVTIPTNTPPTTPPAPPTPPTTPTTPPATGSCSPGTHVAGSADSWGGCWPGPNNTGVQEGLALTNYTGPCTITAANTLIDKKTVNCSLVVKAANVVIKNSKVTGGIDTDGRGYSLLIEDSEISGGDNATVGYSNVTVIRSEITGGQHNILCADNCIVRDSWMHDPNVRGDSHNNAILSNGGDNIVIVHNSIHCNTPSNSTGGGCSGDLSMFGDFSPITNVLVDKNLLLATPGSYCFYGGHQGNKPYGKQANNVDVTNNVFKRGNNNKCATYGPETNWRMDGGGTAPANSTWANNKWEDGAAINN